MNTKHVLALVCLGAASTSMIALAAQPGATPTTPGNAPITAPTTVTPTTPRNAPINNVNVKVPGLTALEADPAKVNIGDPMHFKLDGSGPCQVKFKSDDGFVNDFKGNLPFTIPFTYFGGSMSSFDASKIYSASVTPSGGDLGNCKAIGKGPFTVDVTVVNPHPQSAGAPPKDNTLTVAGKPGITMKPDIAPPTRGVPPPVTTPPVVPPTITSISVSGNAVTGAPITVPGSSNLITLATGSATTLTVNGTGICKYKLSYVNLDANGNTILKPYPNILPKTSSPQNPFAMTMTMLPTTPSGTYQWTATGIDGCTGSKDVTFAVQ
jgi:hypothetical protein